jgi:hypothetical protein
MYGAALALDERLARADPNNSTLQRDLAFSHASLAEAYRRSNEGLKAEQQFKDGRAIIVGLMNKNPADAQRKRDLTWFDAQYLRQKNTLQDSPPAMLLASLLLAQRGHGAKLPASSSSHRRPASRFRSVPCARPQSHRANTASHRP